ncbi:MAG: beta-lactamase family protein [Candidatus Eremiobacteraeota bacterium]|nr:beta-lactamase family protein [Candidatus Eremiobacteraeota bacterium]MBV9263914.1 beta-lactamase family protein [Candidatus Eremiobacteraeota bacterium]
MRPANCKLALAAAMVAALAGPADSVAAGDSRANVVAEIARTAMARDRLKAIVVRVTSGGRNVYTAALGESMYGVPATPQMHFRNGAIAFNYMATTLLELVDRKKVRLDDKLARFFPSLPYASRITLRNLANMTSGYADYVYQPEVLHGVNLDPFRHWTSDELTLIGVRKPMMFQPGTNWGYSHTNYVILGRVIEKITGMPLAQALQTYIMTPMRLTQTRSIDTPAIPTPALHTYSSERREDLKIPPGESFYEDATFWDPSWTTGNGAVQVTDIADMAKSMELTGRGTLLSHASFEAQVRPNLVGFGHRQAGCVACRQNTAEANYGLGVVNLGPWISQIKSFAGCGGTVGYLPARRLTIAVVTTYLPEAFDSKGNYPNASQTVFAEIANRLAPGTLPKLP